MEVGHEVVIANARKVRAISANERKSDWIDASRYRGNRRGPVFRTTTIATIPAVFEFFAGFVP
jgi:hypothetical protein